MNKRILLVAREGDALSAIPITLTLAGHDVVAVGAGLDAIKLARGRQPELIIVDTVLPDMDGATLLEILHRLPLTAYLATLLLKPRSHRLMPPALREEAARRGICQPLDSSELLAAVAKALDICQQIDQTKALEFSREAVAV